MEARAMPPPTRTRRGVTLAEQMAASSNLRDLLKLRDNDDDDDDGGGQGGRRQPRPLPDAVVVAAGRRRTLLDVIRGVDDDDGHDHPPTGVGFAGAAAGVGGRCCVCMARGKAAAFIPCGHTFCRACARELRAGRGRCPLCNAAIHDVLNLF
uniref:RING-type domain-containing protein n=1 Tax=Oryza glumipatula TaxID=40148 RepID=A0A0E0B4Z5_9ORYZ